MKGISINTRLNINFLFIFIILFINGCRKEVPVETDDFAQTDSQSFISISEPVTGARYLPTDTINIIWESTPSIKNVTIELYKKNVSWQLIASRISNDGFYSWKIPASITLSTHYKIKISSSNSPDVLNYSGVFSILLQ